MTKDEFKQLLIRLHPGIKRSLDHNAMYLGEAATAVAAHCFVNNVDDSGDAEELKRQITRLNEKGYFDFDDCTV